jgi:hypothetical protein
MKFNVHFRHMFPWCYGHKPLNYLHAFLVMKIVLLEKPEPFIAGYGLYPLYPNTTEMNAAVQCYNKTKMNINFMSYQKSVCYE